MSKVDFAIGELRCGRLPWVAPEVWAIGISFIVGVVVGVYAGVESLDIIKAAASRD